MEKKIGLKQILKKLYALLDRRQKRSFVIILLIMMISAALTQLTPKAIGWLTDDVLTQETLVFSKVIPMLIFILIVNVINELVKILRRILVEDTATRIEKKARALVITSLLKAPLSYFRENMTGNIHGRLNRCLEGTVKLEKLLFMDFAPAIFNSLAAVFVILTTLPVILAIPMLLVIPIGIAIVLRQIHTQKGIRVELLETKAAMDGSIAELLNGIEVIRITDSLSLEEDRFGKKSEFLRSREMRHHMQMAKYDSMKFINEVFFTVLMIGVSAYLAVQGRISVGAVLTSYLCFAQLIRPLEELHRILDELSESMILADDFFRMAEIPHDFSYTAISAPDTASDAACADPDLITVLHGLRFSYHDKDLILNDLDLEIRKGSFLGIAGPSGCGKSSLIKAICRLEEGSGDLTLAGRPLNSLSRRELSHLIALVPQSPFLIAGTLYENICYGLDRTPEDSEVEEALRRACLSDFIARLPDRLNTFVAEGGGNLSGGQKQRIAIARIFLRRPQILILDEATSALDNTSERFIQNEIETMQKECGMTILSIAHRLTTLKNCDRIIVMNHGVIAQSGTYDELIRQDGIFSDMYHGKLR